MEGKFASELAEIERTIGAMRKSLYTHSVACYGYDYTLNTAIDNVAKALLDAKLALELARYYAEVIGNAGCAACKRV